MRSGDCKTHINKDNVGLLFSASQITNLIFDRHSHAPLGLYEVD